MAGNLTAEIRWWWRSGGEAGNLAWIGEVGSGSCEHRTDTYWCLRHPGLGIKRRGGGSGIEVKSLVSHLSQTIGGGRAELWSKQCVDEANLPHTSLIEVHKKRQLRHFRVVAGRAVEAEPADDPDCQQEYTTVKIGRTTATTACIEARASVDDPLANLSPILALVGPPPLREDALLASYPAWLAQFARD